ncbi:hypothetical protein Hanom_Chr16g01443041 [Helianthus anomalus]
MFLFVAYFFATWTRNEGFFSVFFLLSNLVCLDTGLGTSRYKDEMYQYNTRVFAFHVTNENSVIVIYWAAHSVEGYWEIFDNVLLFNFHV